MRPSFLLDEEDRAIRRTNDEATVGKASAVSLKYYKDDFVSSFIRGPVPQLPPLMNRGHFGRAMAIQQVVERFLAPSESLPDRRNVVVLGAGFDTLFFRLRSSPDFGKGLSYVHFYEVDFDEVMSRKKQVIESRDDMKHLLSISGGQHSLLSCDLRQTETLQRLLQREGLSRDDPTLFVSECVLIYAGAEEGDAVIQWAAERPHSVFCTYEPHGPHDPFGRTMVHNLEARGIPLHSIMKYPDLEAQKKRYRDAGYPLVTARTMVDVYNNYLPHSETRRVGMLEPFDEYEEWNLVLSHYCFVVACSNEKLYSAVGFL